MTPVLECHGLSKRYGRIRALEDFDLTIAPGECVGLLGPNGAGKTSLIKIILGLAMPSKGTLQLFGQDLFRSRRQAIRRVGAVVEAPIFFEYMSAWDNLRYLARLSAPVADDRLREVLRLVSLDQAAERRVGTFSYGMKQRLGIAQALLPDSEFLILDEPTNGLDPHGIAGMRRLIRRLTGELGITVLVASHLLAEVQQVCDRVCIVHYGRKVLEGPTAELIPDTLEVDIRLRPQPGLDERLQPLQPLTVAAADGGTTARFRASRAETPELVRQLVALGLDIESVEPHQHSLEDLFIEHTGNQDDDVRIDQIRD